MLCRLKNLLSKRSVHRHLCTANHVKITESIDEPIVPELEREKKNATFLTLGEKCKNILDANVQGILTTIRSDSESKEELHSSSVPYILCEKNPAIWIPKDDAHTNNVITNKRASLCVDQITPSSLANSLRSVGKLPHRVVMVGRFLSMGDSKINTLKMQLRNMITSEKDIASREDHSVSSILNSSMHMLDARIELFETLLEKTQLSAIYELDVRSCIYVDISGRECKVDTKHLEKALKDPISPFFGALIDGINRNQTRRLGLMLFCYTFLDVHVRDALMLSVDCKGFDVLGKVSTENAEGSSDTQYEWRELSFTFGTEVKDICTFCKLLAIMEEEALKKIAGSVI